MIIKSCEKEKHRYINSDTNPQPQVHQQFPNHFSLHRHKHIHTRTHTQAVEKKRSIGRMLRNAELS